MEKYVATKIKSMELENFNNHLGVMLITDSKVEFLVIDRTRQIVEEYINGDVEELSYIDQFIKEGGKLNFHFENDCVRAEFKATYNKGYLEYEAETLSKVTEDLNIMFKFIVEVLP